MRIQDLASRDGAVRLDRELHGLGFMPAIDALLKRFGFIKLARFGLILTPEGRIMSLRPAVLDDGLGGRIVGWKDGDLAAMELAKWEPARPAPNAAVATRVAVAPTPMLMAKPAAITPVPVVAPPAQVEEDEWEWEIALARARAGAEEVELAATAVRAPLRARPTMPPPILRPADTAPQLAVVRIPAAEPMEFWAKTEELTSIDYEDRTYPGAEISRAARITSVPIAPIPKNDRPSERPLAAPIGVRKPTAPFAIVVPPKEPTKAVPAPIQVARTVPRAGTAPPTVIPIPRLPSLARSPVRTTQIQPVVRAPARRDSRTRFAKGTGPVIRTQIGPPPVRPTEDTIPNLSIGDTTKPGHGLPRAAHAVALPSVKRLAR